jgi:hypothetical protein
VLNAWRELALVALPLVLSATTVCATVDVVVEGDAAGPAQFAAAEILDALSRRDFQGQARIVLRRVPAADSSIRAEGFRIERTPAGHDLQIDVLAIDPAGLMYGGLELAEVIRTTGLESVTAVAQNPYFALRGTKFNIPLDVRSPSYTDMCDAAQNNIAHMWSLDFWKEYIDTLARYRYNYVSLWSLHPFPSLVKVPEYPDVALADVWRSKVRWQEHYPLEGQGFVTDEILREVEIVRRMTIEEKIEFWRQVMAYGKSRHVDFYVVTWNIFTYGTGGKYGITDDHRNPATTAYFRRSVRQLLLTYPDLAGVGLTTGENMQGVDFQAKEDWAMATYGQGVLDAAEAQPGRKMKLIHRQHFANPSDIARTFRPLIDHPDIEFLFSFKYAKAHVYSATSQPYHRDFVRTLGDLKTIWTLRNDDVYYFRWGAPDFVREFVRNIPYEVSRGYYYGSDQYVWGREFMQREASEPRPLEIVKHWYQWLLWGRLAYDPDLDDDRLRAIVALRFGLSPAGGRALFDAWQHASMIYPLTTGLHWGQLDFQWYIEACQSRAEFAQNKTGFHDVNRFINLDPHPRSNCQAIAQFAKHPHQPPEQGKQTPMQVADRLDRHAVSAVKGIAALETGAEGELRHTLVDIRIVAELGSYYADKIRGASQLAIFREHEEPEAQRRAVAHLVDAARHWHSYACLALEHHKNPLWTNRVGHVDWKRNYQHVLEDIRIAGGDPARHQLPAQVDVQAQPVPRTPVSADADG